MMLPTHRFLGRRLLDMASRKHGIPGKHDVITPLISDDLGLEWVVHCQHLPEGA